MSMLERRLTAEQGRPVPLLLRTGLKSTPEAVRRVLWQVRSVLNRAGIAADTAEAVEIALAEVLNNIVQHAYGVSEPGPISLNMHMNASLIVVRISDAGAILPSRSLAFRNPPALLPADVQDLPESGFGWTLVSRLARAVRYARSGDENRLELEFMR